MGIFRNSLWLMKPELSCDWWNTNFHLNDTFKHVSIPGYKTRKQSCFPVHWKTPSSIALWCCNNRPCKNLPNGGFFVNLGFLSHTNGVQSWQMEGATKELFFPYQGWARRLQLQTEAGLGTLSTSWHWLLSLTTSESSHWQTQDHKPPIWIPRLKCSLSLWLLHPRKANFSSQDIWLWASESTSQTTVLRHSSAQDKQLSYSSPHLLWLLFTHSKRTPVILLVSKCVII